jgi:hypothetical protein
LLRIVTPLEARTTIPSPIVSALLEIELCSIVTVLALRT